MRAQVSSNLCGAFDVVDHGVLRVCTLPDIVAVNKEIEGRRGRQGQGMVRSHVVI